MTLFSRDVLWLKAVTRFFSSGRYQCWITIFSSHLVNLKYPYLQCRHFPVSFSEFFWIPFLFPHVPTGDVCSGSSLVVCVSPLARFPWVDMASLPIGPTLAVPDLISFWSAPPAHRASLLGTRSTRSRFYLLYLLVYAQLLLFFPLFLFCSVFSSPV